ncbi:MAG: methionine--tRNA ligase [Candidatus Algichlamydia australiensis]|nr:methionine--tRNA ligase [Chlamydiales bacterium]
MSQAKKYLITSALLYANGSVHFGHIAGCYLPADVFARFARLRGDEVLFLCGSDEYGVAITLSAEIAGRSPKEQVDHFDQINRDLFSKIGISFDHFSRTTWEGHVKTTQEFFLDLQKNGHIEEKVTEQLYSEKEKRFLADRYVLGICPKCGFEEARGDECPSCGGNFEATDLKSPKSKLTGAPLVLKETKHWFLRFDHFRDELKHFIAEKNWKPNVKNFALSYIEDLRERSITRDSDWGVPLPIENSDGKVFYVWFDAPIGYISAAREWAEKTGGSWKDFWCDEKTRFINFVGKDNIPFHAFFFPAMLMGQDQPYKLVDDLPANEFLNLEGKQFSKSSGWYIDLEEFFQHFTADQIRYCLAANSPETQDSEFTWDDFQMRCNAELVGKFGNFANRTLIFVHKRCEGKIPPQNDLAEIDKTFLANVEKLFHEIAFSFEGYHLRKASQQIMELAALGNVYFDAKKPWVTAKDPATFPDTETTLHNCLICLRALSVVSSPIIPDAAEKLAKMIGGSVNSWKMELPTVGEALPEAEILFQKVEPELISTFKEKLT